MPAFLPPALLFFSNALLYISLFTRLPEIEHALQIDKAILGLALLGGPVGTFLALPIAGRVVRFLGPRNAAILTLSTCAVLLPFMTVMPLWGFVLGFGLYAFVRTILEVGQNMVATQIEQRTGKHVMARSHGFWSVGLFIGTIVSGASANLGLSPLVHQSIAGAMVLVVMLVLLRITPNVPMEPPAAKGAGRPTIFVLPNKPILLICAMIFGVAIVEGTVYDWGMFFIRDVLEAGPLVAGLLYACFTVGMGATRLVGDKLRELFQPPTLIRGSAISTAFGVLLLLVAPHLVVAAIGLFFIGTGIALISPIAVSVAVRLEGRSGPDNLAALSLSMMIATLGIPPLMGFIAEHFSLTTTFALLLPGILATFLLARAATPRPPKAQVLVEVSETPVLAKAAE